MLASAVPCFMSFPKVFEKNWGKKQEQIPLPVTIQPTADQKDTKKSNLTQISSSFKPLYLHLGSYLGVGLVIPYYPRLKN